MKKIPLEELAEGGLINDQDGSATQRVRQSLKIDATKPMAPKSSKPGITPLIKQRGNPALKKFR